MANTVRLGIIGLGRLGYEHASNIHYLIRGAELHGVCSVDVEELIRAEREFTPSLLTRDYHEMLNASELDGIVIATNSQTHCRIICDAVKAGVRHIFTEKPIGMSMDEIDEIARTVEGSPETILQVGYNHRFDADLMAAKAQVDAGSIGDIVLVRIESRDQAGIEEFIVKFAPTSGGFIADMMTHDYDTARWFTGSEADTIFGVGGVFAYEGLKACNDMDNTAILMQFKNGVMVVITASRNSAYGYHAPMEVFGTKGAISIGTHSYAGRNAYMSSEGITRKCASWFFEYWRDTYRAEVEDFVRCIREHDQPKVGLEDGYKAIQWAIKANEAVKHKKVVTL